MRIPRVLPLASVLLPLLLACGGSLSQTVWPAPSGGPTPVMVAPGQGVEFTPYGEEEGYLVAAPEGAVTRRRGDATAYVLEGEPLPAGSLTVTVTRIPAAGRSGTELLVQTPPRDAIAPAQAYPLEDVSGSIETARSFPARPGDICRARWVVEGVAVRADVGYLVRIEADAPDRCDARTMPDTPPILETFEVLEP